MQPTTQINQSKLTSPIGRSFSGSLSLNQAIAGAGRPSAGHLSTSVLPALSTSAEWNSIFFAHLGAAVTFTHTHTQTHTHITANAAW